MAVTIKIDPIDRDIKLMIDQTLSPTAQSHAIANYAIQSYHEAADANARVLGRIPPSKRFVDGVEGASEYEVHPHGTIVYEFEAATDLLLWIGKELERLSPIGGKDDPHPGLYKKSHLLFADGVEVQYGDRMPEAEEYIFVSATDYATKIEKGQSSQAPDGVFEVTATLAKRRFGNVGYIEFNYRSFLNTEKYQRLGSAGKYKRGKFSSAAASNPSATRAHNDTRRPSISVRLGGK